MSLFLAKLKSILVVYSYNFRLKKKIYIYEEFGLVTKNGCPRGISNIPKIQGNFYFLNTVLEEQFCVGCADTKFHTIFHH